MGPRALPSRYGEQYLWPALKILGAVFLFFLAIEIARGILATP